MYPDYTPHERFLDSCVHVVGLSLAITAVIALHATATPWLPFSAGVCLVIYSITLITMLGCSAAYHMVPWRAWRDRMRRFDQAAIFLKIAGTYTPFAAVKMTGYTGTGLLLIVWVVAIAGATAKMTLGKRWDHISLWLYLALGWAGILFIQSLVSSIPLSASVLLGVGGIAYTVGTIFYTWEDLPYQNAIWHMFVLIGTASHFAAVAVAMLAT
ncbi:MAG: hemolysin III family protein [Pseudomonadota bacterium]